MLIVIVTKLQVSELDLERTLSINVLIVNQITDQLTDKQQRVKRIR